MTLPNRRHYSRDFKIGAVKLVTEQGYTVNDAASGTRHQRHPGDHPRAHPTNS
jgi:transposase-like protein